MCLKSWGIIREEKDTKVEKDASENLDIEEARFNY